MLLLNKPINSFAQSVDTADENSNYYASREQENTNAGASELDVDLERDNTIESRTNELTTNADEDSEREVLSSDMIADCEAFEKAVEAGDIAKVKEILITLDPDCLKIKNNEVSNLNSVQEMVQSKKNEMAESTSDQLVSTCAKAKAAVEAKDEALLKRILMKEDLSCMEDANGGPSKDLVLLKGLLSYDAFLEIRDDGIVNISGIGFRIDVDYANASGCDDPNYKRLELAIRDSDEHQARAILLNEDLSCPLNEDGVTNDFPFIKELMTYKPRLTNTDGRSLLISGIGININMYDTFKNSKFYSDDEAEFVGSYQDYILLNDVEKSLNKFKVDPSYAVCDDLINAISVNDYKLTQQMLKHLEPDCFHKRTHTTTSDTSIESISMITTPLIAAAREGNVQISKLLFADGADVNFTSDVQETPLMAAAKSGNINLVILYVAEGAQLNTKDEYLKTALDYATESEHDEIIQYLKSKGAK